MLSQTRRLVILAALAALLTLSFAPPAAAQTVCADDSAWDCDFDGDGVPNWQDGFPADATRKWHQPGGWDSYNECERRYYNEHGTAFGTDCDGDGVKFEEDACRQYGPAYGNPPTGADGCVDPAGPEGDTDRDGVMNGKDRCPSQGPGTSGLDASGCPITDGDGDGVTDSKDLCPKEAANKYTSKYRPGCPGKPPVVFKDTPAAKGPSCTKKSPCIVLWRKGLSQKQFGGYNDPDATVKVLIARNAKGVPARVVKVQLRNVDTWCYQYDERGGYVGRKSGPEVSVDLDPLDLKKGRARHVGFSSTVFRFDPVTAVRTIKGQQYELGFAMFKNGVRGMEADLLISSVDRSSHETDCVMDINNDPVTEKRVGR